MPESPVLSPPQESAFWFGPAARPLAGRLHLPADGRSRGGVVLCPGLGWDRTVGHRALRLLSLQLAGAGLAALTVDYDGTGESWGDHADPGRVEAWLASIAAAVGWLRTQGVRDVTLVGLRHGATLAAHAARSADASALVVWDPVVSGRQFVRLLRGFDRLQGLIGDPGTLSMAGAVFTAETVAALRALDLVAAGIPTLAVLRPGEQPPAALAEATVLHRDGQSELLDGDSISARVPTGTLADIADWVGARAPADRRVLATGRAEVTEVGEVRERFVTMAGLAGVETAPTGRPRSGAPTVVLLNNAAEPRTGPGRAWVEWSRTLAGHGLRSLRVDASGIGDSPARADTPEQLPWGPHALADIQALAAAADSGTGVALVGLCSGARNAVDGAAASTGGRVRLVAAINAPLSQRRSVLAQITVADPEPAALVRVNAYRRVRHNLAARTPGPVWRVLDATGVFRAQTDGLRRAVGAGTDVLLIFSEADFGLFKLRQNARWALADLAATGRFALHEVAGADHALFGALGRRAVLAVLTDHLLSAYPPETSQYVSGAPPM